MREVFWVMLSLSLSGAGLAAVVALLQRLLAKRLPAGLFYGLWAAVLLRMIVPAGPLRGVSHEAVVRLEALVQASAVQAQGQTVWQSTALTGTPGGICSSKRVTVGPGVMVTTLALTLKSLRACSSTSFFWS